MRIRHLLLAALAATPLAAIASMNLQGDYLEIEYWTYGVWNANGKGLLMSDGSFWSDVTWPGAAWAELSMRYEQGGATTTFLCNYSGGCALTVLDYENRSEGDRRESWYRYEAGVLTVEKTEIFYVDEKTVLIEFLVENTSGDPVDNFRIMHAIDPDQDIAHVGTFNTINTQYDTMGDEIINWVEARGPTSGWTVGYGLCDRHFQDVGVTPWDRDPDAVFVTGESFCGGSPDCSSDQTIHWRDRREVIEAGETVEIRVIFSTGLDAAEAVDNYMAAAMDDCYWDKDGDGFIDVYHGGDDCDDEDPDVHPEAEEICDGKDNNCDGMVDMVFDEELDEWVDLCCEELPWWPDADGDGFGDASAEPIWDCEQPEGYVDNDLDCDDDDPEIHPDAEEVCDGIDNNCDGLVDMIEDPSTGELIDLCFVDEPDPGASETRRHSVGSTCGCASPAGVPFAPLGVLLLPLLALRRRR